MSVQVFLQGKLEGIEEFLRSPAHADELSQAGPCGELVLLGRCYWVTLLAQVIPRALLAELELARILLGSSGGGQFLLILPGGMEDAAQEFLRRVASEVSALSNGHLRLVWGTTEALGDWTVVRRRLQDELSRATALSSDQVASGWFAPFVDADVLPANGYFLELARHLREARTVGWTPESPGRILLDQGKHQWPLDSSPDGIHIARHVAVGEDQRSVATPLELAARAQGTPLWGVLRGDVDEFGWRLWRCQSIEEHVQTSVLYREFFAGELEVLCSMPEFWRRVTVLYAGLNDFAVLGSWDALVLFARELQRVFHRFNEENLKDLPGPEGKTISMALALAWELDEPATKVFEEAGRRLGEAKATDRDRFHVFGRVIEWRHLAHAAQVRETIQRLARHHSDPLVMLTDLERLYRTAETGGRSSLTSYDRPWRYYRRLSLAAGASRDRELQRLRSQLIQELIGRSAAEARLRPGGRVALQWARLLMEA